MSELVTVVSVSPDHDAVDRLIHGMAEVLVDCVEGGASVGFMLPLSPDRAAAYWRNMVDGAGRGERRVMVAIGGTGDVLGTVQVVLITPENQPHRGEISKMLVHRRARRQGVADALMHAAEQVARDAGRTLLVLDTASADAERLYTRHGYERVGVIPDYALLPEGGLVDTVLFFKRLAG